MQPPAGRQSLLAAAHGCDADNPGCFLAGPRAATRLSSQGLLEGVCVTVTSAVDVPTMTDANNRYE